MKAVVAFACLALAATPAHANAPRPAPDLALPASRAQCLEMLERVFVHALDADLLDDQNDQADALLEKLEDACYGERFPEALDHAKAVLAIVATNK